MGEELFFQGKLYRGVAYYYPKDETRITHAVPFFDGEERETLKRAIRIAKEIPRYPEGRFGSYSRGIFFGVREVVKGRGWPERRHVFIPFLLVAKAELLPRFSALLECDGFGEEVALCAVAAR